MTKRYTRIRLIKEFALAMRDLKGQRFGRLVAIEPTEKRSGNSVVWRCQCDCGNACEVPSSSLTSGNTKSCGCMKGGTGERKVGRDLTGERFGKLVAVRPIGRRNRSVLWECRCDCGNMKEVVGHHLTTGKVRSCGCLMGERSTPPGRAIDLTGQQFGDLIVIERSGTRNRYALWTCRCSCGATHEATSNELRSGRVTNCGGPQHDVDVIVPGRRFGKLTAVSKTDEVCDGSPVWRCLCDCDRTRKCTERELLEGRALSCGKCDA